MTYREVGVKEGLRGFRLDFFVSYMVQRWGDTEQQKCEDGYAGLQGGSGLQAIVLGE